MVGENVIVVVIVIYWYRSHGGGNGSVNNGSVGGSVKVRANGNDNDSGSCTGSGRGSCVGSDTGRGSGSHCGSGWGKCRVRGSVVMAAVVVVVKLMVVLAAAMAVVPVVVMVPVLVLAVVVAAPITIAITRSITILTTQRSSTNIWHNSEDLFCSLLPQFSRLMLFGYFRFKGLMCIISTHFCTDLHVFIWSTFPWEFKLILDVLSPGDLYHTVQTNIRLTVCYQKTFLLTCLVYESIFVNSSEHSCFELESVKSESYLTYRHTSNIRRILVGNKTVDHSDVVGASPVGAAPTTSSRST